MSYCPRAEIWPLTWTTHRGPAFQTALGNLSGTLGGIEPIASSGRSFSIVGQTLSAQIVSSTVLMFEHSDNAAAASEALQSAFDADGIEDYLISALGPISEAVIQMEECTVITPDYALEYSTALWV